MPADTASTAATSKPEQKLASAGRTILFAAPSGSTRRVSTSSAADRPQPCPASAPESVQSHDSAEGAAVALAACAASTSPPCSASQASAASDAAARVAVQDQSRPPSASPAAEGSVSSRPSSASPQVHHPGPLDGSASQPSLAPHTSKAMNGDHAPAAPKDCMVAISLYPKDLPASQVQMHAAASAALHGAVLEVSKPS